MKLLVLLPRVPYPLEKGDKLRAFYQIKELSKYHDIYLVALQDVPLHPEALDKIKPYCKEIHLIKLSWFSKFWGIVRAFLKGLPGFVVTGENNIYAVLGRYLGPDSLQFRDEGIGIGCQLFRGLC